MAVLEKENQVKYEEESSKTKRAREKLKRHLNAIDAQITHEALKKTRVEIHQWIARHAHHRVPLKEKNISLFDENQNTAGLSQRVASLAQQIQTDRETQFQNFKKLEGTFSKTIKVSKES